MDFIKELFNIETKHYTCSECGYKSKFRRHLILHTDKNQIFLDIQVNAKGKKLYITRNCRIFVNLLKSYRN
jgi:hypothetical protein